ncbi:hypothetical protein ACHQM5_022759 [Ranunculus cassubicifolius]
MASSFSFPILNRKEIVAILSETGIIAIREQDLINPNPDNIISIYNAILIYLDPLQDDNEQANFHALGRLDNPDLHLDSVRVLNLLSKIKELVKAVGCNGNFTMKDLLKPDTDRTGIFLSAILNFCLHRESKLNLIQPAVDQANLHDEKQRQLEARIQQLNEEMSEIEAAREMEQPFVQEIDAQVKELRQTIHNLNNHQSTLKSEFLKLREKSNELIEKITNADFTLTQSEQENRKLQSMIVQSPEKLQGALEEKKIAWDEIKRSERTALQSLQEKNATLEVYSKACEKMAKQLAQMQAIQEQVNSSKTIEKDVKVLKSKLTEEIVLDKSLEAKIVERQGQAEQMKELSKAFEKERDLKIEEVTKEINRVKLEVDSEKRKMVSRQKNVEATCIEVDKVVTPRLPELGCTHPTRGPESSYKPYTNHWPWAP